MTVKIFLGSMRDKDKNHKHENEHHESEKNDKSSFVPIYFSFYTLILALI